MRIPGGSAALQDDFVKHLTNKDLLSGGSIAKAALGDELLDNVHRQLYFDEERHAQRPATGGTFAAAVAEYALTRMDTDGHCGVTIVTTNYDSLIEEAFETSPDLEALVESHNIRVVPVYDGSYEPQPFDTPIYHIHGYIPRIGPKSRDIILSERDYGDSTNIAWAADLMAHVRQATGPILGASIQDPNLNRYLSTSAVASGASSTKSGLPAKRFAAVALQSQPWSHEDVGLRRALLWADARRLGTLEVESIQADFFAQIPQLLKEVILARNTGISAYFSARSQTRYGVRLMRWSNAIRRTRLADGSAKGFAKAQAQANRLMMDCGKPWRNSSMSPRTMRSLRPSSGFAIRRIGRLNSGGLRSTSPLSEYTKSPA
jgi:SIR2-like domain